MTYGSIGAGDVTETYVDDGQYLQVDEVAGGNASQFDFVFEGLPDEVSVYTAKLNCRCGSTDEENRRVDRSLCRFLTKRN